MRVRSNWWLFVSVSLFLVAPAWAAETPAEKAERMKWWVDARFGMFIHWGPVSLKGTESAGRGARKCPSMFTTTFTSSSIRSSSTPDQYVALAKEAGVKYITLVAKHHDGFAMYATRLSDYNIMHTPFRARRGQGTGRRVPAAGPPVLHLLFDHRLVSSRLSAARAGDKRPPKDAHFDNYLAFMKGQLREIVKNYHPAVMWFDGEWEDHWTVQRGQDIYAMLRNSIRRSS